jgi:ABC-type transport system substrate-binding protein
MDPAMGGDVPSVSAIAKVYETLLEYDYTNRPYALRPCLAAAMPDISPDGCLYRFRIRQGIRFHDDPCFKGGRGRELRSDDFAYSFKRLADAKLTSPGFGFLRDRIVGLDDFHRASSSTSVTDYAASVAGLGTPDAQTLEIRLTQPFPQLLWVLAMSYCAAVPSEAVQFHGAEFSTHPVGTGPFRLHEWQRNYRVEFRLNPGWKPSLPPAAAPAPPPDCIFQYVISDPSTRWLQFLSGGLDLCSSPSRDHMDAAVMADGTLAPALAAQGIRLASIPSLNTFYISFNMDDPVVGKNLPLRQALSHAIDAEAWVRFYKGRIRPARGPIPPNVAGAPPDATLPYPFNIERARSLLRQAGYPDGTDPKTGKRLHLTLDIGRTDVETRESTELLVSFFDRIGVSVSPSYNSTPTFFKKIERREAQMFRLGWYADYPDAENFLQLFYAPNSSPGPNRANYANPEFDRLFEQARAMTDTPERADLYRRMDAIVVADAPWIFLHHPVDHTLYHERLEGYIPHDFPYGMEKHYRLRGQRP